MHFRNRVHLCQTTLQKQLRSPHRRIFLADTCGPVPIFILILIFIHRFWTTITSFWNKQDNYISAKILYI